MPIHRFSLTWFRLRKAKKEARKTGPLPLPDRARIRRVAERFHMQMKDAERDGRVDEVVREQANALRGFMLEMSPEAANDFMNVFTEESSALERESIARRKTWRPAYEIPTVLVTTLVFIVTVLAILLAIRYAV